MSRLQSPISTTDDDPARKKQKLTDHEGGEQDEEATNQQDIAEAIVAAASAAATAAVDAGVTIVNLTEADSNSCNNNYNLNNNDDCTPAFELDEPTIDTSAGAVVAPTTSYGHDYSMEAPADAATAALVATSAVVVAPEPPFSPRIPPPNYVPGIQPSTKHDEKWNDMFYKLQDYKQEHGNSLVPQNFKPDIKLGRWVHYQRVEFWLYQQRGQGKITSSRIKVLEDAGFEWDPQRAQWNALYERLAAFKRMHAHCQVPKGFKQDKELANWVRNQRLEYTNKLRGKKNRMTEDRQVRLEALGFKWSVAVLGLGTEEEHLGDIVAEGSMTMSEQVIKSEAEVLHSPDKSSASGEPSVDVTDAGVVGIKLNETDLNPTEASTPTVMVIDAVIVKEEGQSPVKHETEL